MKPYYDHNGITIYHGDSRKVHQHFRFNSFDAVVTSPPYNMGLVPGGNGRGMYRPGASSKAGRFREGYGVHADAMPQDEYDEWQRHALQSMMHLASKAVYYNHRPRVEHGKLRLPLGMQFPDKMPLRQIIIWDRGTGIDVNLRNYCTRQEWILLFASEDFKLVSHSASGAGDVWRLGMEHGDTGHPAPFPVSLPTRALKTSGAASVLDPYMGSGSTLVAAKNLGIRAVGIEINERYCEIAAKRLSQEVLFASALSGDNDATPADAVSLLN